MLKRLAFFFALFLPAGAFAQVQYEIVSVPVCWNDSSLIKYTYVTTSGAYLDLGYFSPSGAPVTVSGGTLKTGFCFDQTFSIDSTANRTFTITLGDQTVSWVDSVGAGSGGGITTLRLGELTDVDTTGEATGSIILYDATSGNWKASEYKTTIDILDTINYFTNYNYAETRPDCNFGPYDAARPQWERIDTSTRDPSNVVEYNGKFYFYGSWFPYGSFAGTESKGIQVFESESKFGPWIEKGLVLTIGASGSFDAGAIFTPNVFVENDTFYLTYSAWDGGIDGRWNIGMAYSTNPLSEFTKLSSPILYNSFDQGTGAAWDDFRVDETHIIKVNSTTYRMYYKGVTGTPPYLLRKTGYAYSNNILSGWTKYASNPVLNTTNNGSQPESIIVWIENNKYWMAIAPLSLDRIEFFSSDNGQSWTYSSTITASQIGLTGSNWHGHSGIYNEDYSRIEGMIYHLGTSSENIEEIGVLYRNYLFRFSNCKESLTSNSIDPFFIDSDLSEAQINIDPEYLGVFGGINKDFTRSGPGFGAVGLSYVPAPSSRGNVFAEFNTLQSATANFQVQSWSGSVPVNKHMTISSSLAEIYNTFKLNNYGLGNKEATDLSKTRSAYIAAFATDGTLLELDTTGLYASGATTLNGLTDVVLTSPQINDVLKYNGTNWVNGSDLVNDADADPTNELQDLSLTGNTLSLSGDATTVDLSGYLDDQTVSLTGAGITVISGTYPNFTITTTEVDGSTTNEIQTLSLDGNTLSISGGNSVNLSGSGGSGIDLTDLSVTVAAAGSANLSYNNTNGVFTYTPPDLTGYLTSEVDGSVSNEGALSASALVSGSIARLTSNTNGGSNVDFSAGTGIAVGSSGGNTISITNTLPEATTASNGLTEQGNDIKLGGTLSESTTIAMAGNDMTFTGTSGSDMLIDLAGSTTINSTNASGYNSSLILDGVSPRLLADAKTTEPLNIIELMGGRSGVKEMTLSSQVSNDNTTYTAMYFNPTRVSLKTPNVVDLTAQNGQFLQLVDRLTGEVEFASALSAEVDGSVSNEGALSPGTGVAGSSVFIQSNTSGSSPVTISVGNGLDIAASGQTIFLNPEAFPIENGTSGAISWGGAPQRIHVLDFGANTSITLSFTNVAIGGIYTLRVTGNSGTDTLIWPASAKFEDGTSAGTVTLQNGGQMFTFYWDGTNYWVK